VGEERWCWWGQRVVDQADWWTECWSRFNGLWAQSWSPWMGLDVPATL